MAVVNLGKVCMTPKGIFNILSRYEKLDVVTYNNSSYICIVDYAVGQLPTNATYWQPLAQGVIPGIANVNNASEMAAFATATQGGTADYGYALINTTYDYASVYYNRGDVYKCAKATGGVTYAYHLMLAADVTNAVKYKKIVETTLTQAAKSFTHTITGGKSYSKITALIFVPPLGGSTKGNFDFYVNGLLVGKVLTILNYATNNSVIRLSAKNEGVWVYDMAFASTTADITTAFDYNLPATTNMYGSIGRNQITANASTSIGIASNINLPVGTYIKLWGVEV